MNFTFAHNNYNVLDLEKSIKFYKDTLNLEVTREILKDDFKIVFLGDGTTPHLLELTWLKGWQKPYNLGDNEFHLALRTADFDDAYEKHKQMGVICFENKEMGIYFISDPDGYWVEIIPER